MKKQWNWILAVCLTAGVLLTGCGGAASQAGGAASRPQSESAAASSAASGAASRPEESPWNNSLIGEAFTAEGEGTDELGEAYTYSFHVPELLDDTNDARAINDHIDEFITAGCVAAMDEMKQGMAPWQPVVQWTGHWYGSILSLVIEQQTAYHGSIYSVFLYDFDEGHTVHGWDLHDVLGITEDAYWQGLRRAAAHEFDRQMSFWPPEVDLATRMEMRAATLSRYSMDNAQEILLEDGTLQVVFDLQTPAGGGSMQVLLTPDFAPEPGPALQDEYDCVTAALRGGELNLAWRGTPGAADHMGQNTAIGEGYRVHGLYGNYVDMAVGNLSDDAFPFNHYVVLLDDLGGISFCNVTACALSGDYYVLCGPFWPAQDIVSVESAPMPGEGIYAVTKNGSKIDLREALQPVFMQVPVSMANSRWDNPQNAWSFYSENGEYGRSIQWNSLDGGSYSGSMDFVGMTGEGLVYQWLLLDWNNELTGGVLIQNCEPQNIYGGSVPSAELRQYVGAPMQGLDENGIAVLERNWEYG